MFEKILSAAMAVIQLFSPAVGSVQSSDAITIHFDVDQIYVSDTLLTDEQAGVILDEKDELHGLRITQPGTYVLSGRLDSGYVDIDLEKEGVANLILSGVSIRNNSGPAIMFSDVYECSSGDDDSVIQDTSDAGAVVQIADGTDNILTSHSTTTNTGALHSAQTMNILGGEQGTGSLMLMSEGCGISSNQHISIYGGNITAYTEDLGISAGEDKTLAFNGGSVAVYAMDGYGLSSGHLLLNGADVAVSTSSEGSAFDASSDVLVNSGIVAASGGKDGLISAGEQATMELRSAVPLRDVTVVDSNGSIVYSYNITKDENYYILDVGRTFTDLVISNAALQQDVSYRLYTCVELSGTPEYKNGVLVNPDQCQVKSGFPLRYETAEQGNHEVYDLMDLQARTFLTQEEKPGLYVKREATSFESAVQNAQSRIMDIDTASAIGSDLHQSMVDTLKEYENRFSASFKLSSSATIFSNVIPENYFDANGPMYDLPANMDIGIYDYPAFMDYPAYLSNMNSEQMDYGVYLEEGKLDLDVAQNISPTLSTKDYPVSMQDYPVNTQPTAPNQEEEDTASQELLDALISIKNRYLFYNGEADSIFTNENGSAVSGELLEQTETGKAILEMRQESYGALSNVNMQQIASGTALSLSDRSTLFLQYSDLATLDVDSVGIELASGAILDLFKVSAWTECNNSPLIAGKDSTVKAKNVRLETNGDKSPLVVLDGGSAVFDQADFMTMGANSPIAMGSGSFQFIDIFATMEGGPVFILDGSKNKTTLSVENSRFTVSSSVGVSTKGETNTILDGVEFTHLDTLYQAGADANGTLTLQNMSAYGSVHAEQGSKVDLFLSDYTSWTGLPTGSGEVSIHLDNTSVWCLTGNCTIRSLNMVDGADVLDQNGNPVTILDGSGSILRRGSGQFTLTILEP